MFILFKFKEGENFIHRNIKEYFDDSDRVSLRAKFEPDIKFGQKVKFCKDLKR